MRAVLSQRHPDHSVAGEEFGEHNPGHAAIAGCSIPVDGTRAFITGRPLFGTLVALLDNDTPILGVIDQPIIPRTLDRRRSAAPRSFRGEFGQAGCRPCANLAAAELSCTSPQMNQAEPELAANLLGQVARVTYGGDCYAYGLLALGQIDVIAEATMQLLGLGGFGAHRSQGAGGSITDWHGAPAAARMATAASSPSATPSLLPAAIAALAP